jgi:hypothetical protein
MNAKYTFGLTSQDSTRDFPSKIIIGQQQTETVVHVALKLLGYLLFFRERLQIEPRLPNDAIPYVPDLVQLDYELRVQLWVECGECSVSKLHKLAVKTPEADIWIVKKSFASADDLLRSMQREEFRTGRYHIIGLDQKLFNEVCDLIQSKNELFWLKATFDPPEKQFDLNGLWFEMPFKVLHY